MKGTCEQIPFHFFLKFMMLRSTGDIFDIPKSYKDIFKSQVENIEGNAPDCYNDMDMLITGMHGSGNVGLNGCTDQQYLQHFAMWSFLGSPLIMGADLRKIDKTNKDILLNKGLIAINQDEEYRPAFLVDNMGDKRYILAKLLSGNRIALAFFNLEYESDYLNTMEISFCDLGIHSGTGIKMKFTNAVTGESIGVYQDAFSTQVLPDECKITIAEMILPEKE